MQRDSCKVFILSITLLFTLFFAACKGLFQSEPEDQSKNEFGLVDTRPAWSPDGKTIAYAHVPQDSMEQSLGSTPRQIWLIEVDGSNRRFLTPGNSCDWSPDGEKIVFSDGRILIYDLNSDEVTVVERYYKSVTPAWSPDGKIIAYTNSICSGDTCGIWFASPDGSNRRYVIRFGGHPAWAPDGKSLLYTLGTTEIWRYSLHSLDSQLVLNSMSRSVGAPSLSPDGKMLLWQNQEDGERPQIWVMELDTGSKQQLTSEGGERPYWSPDGKQIVYGKYEPDGRIWIMNADGSGKRQLTY